MEEIFVKDKETGLLVSNLGRIIGLRGKILRGHIVKSGHILISTGSKMQIFAHRLVARNFIKNENNLPFVNHKDENPANNRVENLEWCTSEYNNTYGTIRERHKRRLKEIGFTRHCILEKDGELYESESYVDMAKKIGVSPSGIAAIIKGRISHSRGFHLPGVKPSENREMPPQEVTITNGKEIKTFHSQAETARFLKVHSSKVCKMVHGERYSVRGWHIPGRNPNRRPAFQGILTLTNGIEIRKFRSVSEAARSFNVHHSQISQMISGKIKSCRGWKLVKES